MTTITIPKELHKDKDLVAVPRGTYEEFLAWQKKVKSIKTFKPSASVKRALIRARKNFARGKYMTLEKLQYELERTR